MTTTIDRDPGCAFQGEHGAYSELAARTLLGDTAALLPCVSLGDVCDAVLQRRAAYGVVPLENTIAGTVPGAYELLLAHDLRVVAETRVAIDHVLIGTPGMTLDAVRRVLSHPVALDQCRGFLGRHPAMEPVAVFDTAGAVRIIMREGDGVSAAVAGRQAAAAHGGHVLAEGLQDHPENWTRFGLLVRSDEARDSPGPTRILAAFSLPHVAGSLARALAPAGAGGVNLTKIESRPIPTQPFEYRFIVELESRDSALLQQVAGDMSARTTGWRVLGAYAGNGQGGES